MSWTLPPIPAQLSSKARSLLRLFLRDGGAWINRAPRPARAELERVGIPIQYDRVRDEGTWVCPLCADHGEFGYRHVPTREAFYAWAQETLRAVVATAPTDAESAPVQETER